MFTSCTWHELLTNTRIFTLRFNSRQFVDRVLHKRLRTLSPNLTLLPETCFSLSEKKHHVLTLRDVNLGLGLGDEDCRRISPTFHIFYRGYRSSVAPRSNNNASLPAVYQHGRHRYLLQSPFSHCGNTSYKRFSLSASLSEDVSPNEASKAPSGDSLLKMNPRNFIEYLKSEKIRRCYFVKEDESDILKCSHDKLQDLCHVLEGGQDFKGHEAIFLELGKRTNCLFGAFLWRTMRGQAYGGIRLLEYKTIEDFLRDGLRLSVALGEKAALAGLWVGGGKGIIAMPDENKHLQPDFRSQLFYDYGDFLTSLNGCLVGGLGLGSSSSDMDNVNLRSRYITCLSTDRGGVGNPSRSSGKGVICAMEAALDFLKMGTFDGKVIAIQGAGNVAVALINELLDRNAKYIHVTDVHNNRVQDVKDLFQNKGRGRLMVEKVPIDSNAILEFPCDILSPCALGNVLNKDTIPKIQAKIICGSANNQVERDEDNQLIADQGITYIPDFLANRMALVKCTHEPYGRLPDDPHINKHFDREWPNSIYVMTKKILKNSRENKITPAQAAVTIAEHLSKELNPIYPNRSRGIILSLVQSEWQKEEMQFWQQGIKL